MPGQLNLALTTFDTLKDGSVFPTSTSATTFDSRQAESDNSWAQDFHLIMENS
jgi:hypothetical protein